MKIGLLAGLILFVNQSVAGGLLFDIKSSNDSISVPITLCLNGMLELSCQYYTVHGFYLFIKTNTVKNIYFPTAGIKVNATGYTPNNCFPFSSGYCIFEAASYKTAHIGLK